MKTDIVIIGGGPAGFSSALTLRQRGFDVAVLEKKVFPRDKVCGEFIAPAGVSELEKLGVLEKIILAGARGVNRLVLYSGSGSESEIILEEGSTGLAISRGKLDSLLFDEIISSGVNGLDGCRVENIKRDSSGVFTTEYVSCRSGKKDEFVSRGVVNASGINGLGVRGRVKKNRIYGFKVHLRGVDCAGATELFFYSGGYGGLVGIEDDMTCLAFQVNKEQVSLMKNHPLDIIRKLLPPDHAISRRLCDAVPTRKWIAMGCTTYGSAKYIPGVCSIGDASGQIDPFTGLGMSLALREGRLAGENFDINNIHQKFFIKKHLHLKRYLVTLLLRNILYKPFVCNSVIPVVNKFPSFGRGMIKLLHG